MKKIIIFLLILSACSNRPIQHYEYSVIKKDKSVAKIVGTSFVFIDENTVRIIDGETKTGSFTDVIEITSVITENPHRQIYRYIIETEIGESYTVHGTRFDDNRLDNLLSVYYDDKCVGRYKNIKAITGYLE